eukprot:642610-Pyramimonas_sp.AAC.1
MAEWQHVQIAEYARYLGVLIGPAVILDIQWKAAFDKYWLRVVQLAASVPGPAVALKLYNTCVITVLSYLTQYFPFPATFLRHERGTLRQILRSPPTPGALSTSSALARGRIRPPPTH